MKVWVKDNYELPELTYELDGEYKGGFTLLESPAEKRVYEIDTSDEILKQIRNNSEKYEVIE